MSPIPAPAAERATGRTSAGRTIATVLLALALGSLLCADSLVQVAERQPFGSTRDLALSVTRPLRSLSHGLGLHLPRRWLIEATDSGALPTSAAGQTVDVPSATAPTSSATSSATTPATAPVEGAASSVPPTVASTATLPLRRVPTAADPLRVVMMGDSLMGQVSLGFGRLVRDDPRITLTQEYRISTGLARPDVLDWPAYLGQQLPALGAEVVFLSFGGNDDQDMQLADGTRVSIHTPEWRAEYANRVGLAMDVAAAGDRTVVWLGLPAEAPERLNTVKDVMNEVGREQAALRPRVIFLDVGAVLTPDGHYQDTLTRPDGSTVLVRERDGVHLTPQGGDILAPTLLAAIATDWNL